jgi:hypothetical protein
MTRCLRALITAGLLALTACGPSKVHPLPVPPVPPSAATADVVILNTNATVVVRVGQTIGWSAPIANATWRLEYNHDALSLLTRADRETKPGDPGWVWLASLAGQFDLAITAVVPCARPPCTPTTVRFAVTIEVRPRLTDRDSAARHPDSR